MNTMNTNSASLYSYMLVNEFSKLCLKYQEFVDNPVQNSPQKTRKLLLDFLLQVKKLASEGKICIETFRQNVKTNLGERIPLEIPWFLHICDICPLKEHLSTCEDLQFVSSCLSSVLQDIHAIGNELATKMCFEYLKTILTDTNQRVKQIEQLVLNDLVLVLKQNDCEITNFRDLPTPGVSVTLAPVACERISYERNVTEIPEDAIGRQVGIPLEMLSKVLNQLSAIGLESLVSDFLKKFFKGFITGERQTIRDIFTGQQQLFDTAEATQNNVLMMLLFKINSATEIAALVSNIVSENELATNWRALFNFLLCFCNHQDDSCALLKQLLQNLLKVSLEESNADLLAATFVIARFCCIHMALTFKSYLQWFGENLSSDSGRPVNTKQKGEFFMDFLTNVIDCEQAVYLRVHINRVPSVPADCHGLVSDYVKIVKTRLVDLCESPDLGFYENNTTKSTEENDVFMFLKIFSETNDIPSCVLEGSMFCKTYFERKFLVELLSRFEGKTSTRHKAIVKLHAMGKIPNSLFAKYKLLM